MKRVMYLTLMGVLSTISIFSQDEQVGPERSPAGDARREATAFVTEVSAEYRSPMTASFQKTMFASSKGSVVVDIGARAVESRPGEVVGLSASGDTQFIAHYKKNRLIGNWITKFNVDRVCDSGGFKNNIPHGVWKSWYPNGKLRSIRTYDAFKLAKAKRDIALSESKAVMSPIADIARKNPAVAYSFLMADYSFHTLAVQPALVFAANNWLSLTKRIAYNLSHESSYVPPFSECLHHGLYMNFYETGSVKDSGYYKDGVREGMWEEWLHGGHTRSYGFYRHGHRVDIWKFYNTSGKLIYVKAYNRNGREIHHKTFDW
jgi:antitoxin component YwqK of YwqJK toxin-antitoxin module